MTISKEAVEAALDAWDLGWRNSRDATADELCGDMSNALTAALPHLAPQPSQSDEERARLLIGRLRAFEPEDADMAADEVVEVLTAVRDACAKILDVRATELRKQKLLLSDVQAEQLERCAAAIRVRSS